MAIQQLNLPQIYQAAQQAKATERQNMLAQMQMDQIQSQIDAQNQMKAFARDYTTSVENGTPPAKAREAFFNKGIGTDVDATAKYMQAFSSMSEQQREDMAWRMDQLGRQVAAINSPEEFDQKARDLDEQYPGQGFADFVGKYDQKDSIVRSLVTVADQLNPKRDTHLKGNYEITEEIDPVKGTRRQVASAPRWDPDKMTADGKSGLTLPQQRHNAKIQQARENFAAWVAGWETKHGKEMSIDELRDMITPYDEWQRDNPNYSPANRSMIIDAMDRMYGDDPGHAAISRYMVLRGPEVDIEDISQMPKEERRAAIEKILTHPNRDMIPESKLKALSEQLDELGY